MANIQPILLAIGGVLTALSGAMAAWALILSRRSEARSANKDETEQAFELQQKSMENVERDNQRLRQRQDQLHDQVNGLVGRLGEMTVQHRRCEESLDEAFNRLRVAEARILELGG